MLEEFCEQFLRSGAVMACGEKELVVGWGETKSYAECPQEQEAFYFPDYFLSDPRPWKCFQWTKLMTVDQLLERIGQGEEQPSLEWKNPFHEHFCQVFDDLQLKFTQGTLKKAVPYAFTTSANTMSCDRLRQSLSHALPFVQKHPLFLYGFWNNGEGILGASPERLVTVERDAVATVAVAGTGKKGINLMDDPKECHEHQLVIDGIVNQLSAIGSVSIGKLALLELPSLVHLITPLQLSLKEDVDLTSLIQALHPTPALGTFPLENGRQWLVDQNRALPRHRYGAPTGISRPHHRRFDSYVAIRNVQWTHDKMEIGAGCGVVPQSQCSREWNEIQLKIHSIQEIFAL